MTETSVISKISVKTIGCNPKRAAALPEGSKEVVKLASIIGQITECKEKKRTLPSGEVTFDYPLIGNFEATNLETGEIFSSGQMYLPGGIHELAQAEINKEGVTSIEFGMILGAVRSSNAAGYSYVGNNVLDFKQSDPLKALREAAAAKVALVLNGPAKTEALEAAKAPAALEAPKAAAKK